MLAGQISYTHSGREEISQDSFTVTVSDGYYEDTKQVPVDIALLDDETPRIKINDGLRLKVSQSSKLIICSPNHADQQKISAPSYIHHFIYAPSSIDMY